MPYFTLTLKFVSYILGRIVVPINESKEIIKKYEELWSKIRDLIRLKTKNPDDYDEKYMKIKFNSEDELPLNRTTEIHSMVIAVRAGFL